MPCVDMESVLLYLIADMDTLQRTKLKREIIGERYLALEL